MSYNIKNYTEQGGEKTAIGGTLEIQENGKLEVQENASLEIQENGKLAVKENGTLEVQANGTLAVKANGTLEVQENASLEIQGNGKLEVQGNGTLEVQDSGKLAVQENAALEIQGNGMLEVKENGSIEIKSGGTLELKAGAHFVNNSGEGSINPAIYLPTSAASSTTVLTKDYNALVNALKVAGFVASTAPTMTITTQPTDASGAVSASIILHCAAAISDGRAVKYRWYSNTTKSNTGGTSIQTGVGYQSADFTAPTNSAGTSYYYCKCSEDSDATLSVVEQYSNAVEVVVA